VRRGAAIIVDVQATPARWSAEVAATKTMLERTETCFGLNPKRLAAIPWARYCLDCQQLVEQGLLEEE